MILRLLRQLNRAYGYAVFGIYLAAFGIAFLFVFIFPPATLALLFISIFGLLFFNVLGFVLRTIEKRWNRARLDKGLCPECGAAALSAVSGRTGEIRCGACDARHDAQGAWIKPLVPEPEPVQA
ncbi:MAG: hypothetical protein FJ252_00225 [Phycisphaerae bacterium]|nr:hypothetical protein [Phycisphaerae bacterium]